MKTEILVTSRNFSLFFLVGVMVNFTMLDRARTPSAPLLKALILVTSSRDYLHRELPANTITNAARERLWLKSIICTDVFAYKSINFPPRFLALYSTFRRAPK